MQSYDTFCKVPPNQLRKQHDGTVHQPDSQYRHFLSPNRRQRGESINEPYYCMSEPSWTFFTADLCCVHMSLTGWYSILSTSPGRPLSDPNIWSHLASGWKPKDKAQPWEKTAQTAVCFCSTSSRSQVHTPLLCAAQCEQPGQTSEWKKVVQKIAILDVPKQS